MCTVITQLTAHRLYFLRGNSVSGLERQLALQSWAHASGR
jgi:hypothetical protein